MPIYSLGGNEPIWNEYCIPDLFADPFINKIKRKNKAPAPPFHVS